MSVKNWKTQLRKGLLELCVLNRLRYREYYGYDLVQELKAIDVLQMRECTVYPILARLEEDGLVASQLRPSVSGPPRKYFSITSSGKRIVKEMNGHWERVQKAVEISRSSGREVTRE